jgi:hypothetical protein
MILIMVSGAMGVGFYLYRRYYENGELTKIDLFATVATVVIFAVIVIFVCRIANRRT